MTTVGGPKGKAAIRIPYVDTHTEIETVKVGSHSTASQGAHVGHYTPAEANKHK